jgi:hypothetical protein
MASELERTDQSLGQLHEAGELDDPSRTALETQSVRAELAAGLGGPSTADELLLATILIDDSASIVPNIAEIRHGHNTMLEALEGPGTAEVCVQTRALNGGVLSPYLPIDQAMRLNSHNFGDRQISSAGTPLYRQSVVTLGTVMVKAREEAERGAKVRTFTLIITDAENLWLDSSITAKHVNYVITDMLEYADNHIVAGMGVGERPDISFHDIFDTMGIQRRWMFSSAADAERLREEFDKISRDLKLAAASETGFGQLVSGADPS